MDRAERRRAVRAAIDAGRLPRTPPTRLFAGQGAGEPCDGCGEPIESGSPEYEFDFDGRSVRMHRLCFSAWTSETGTPE